eukprot:33879-Prymnesium_polylepis.3
MLVVWARERTRRGAPGERNMNMPVSAKYLDSNRCTLLCTLHATETSKLATASLPLLPPPLALWTRPHLTPHAHVACRACARSARRRSLRRALGCPWHSVRSLHAWHAGRRAARRSSASPSAAARAR